MRDSAILRSRAFPIGRPIPVACGFARRATQSSAAELPPRGTPAIPVALKDLVG